MCGIVYLKRNDGHSPIKPLLSRYHEQKSRGQQGYGFVAVKAGKVIGYERSMTFDEIEKKIALYHDSDEILFHHRYPTSTDNLEETAHPIYVSNKSLKNDYYLVHNGGINNCGTLKELHEKAGFVYNTEVEIITGYKQKHKSKKKKREHVEIKKVEFNDTESLAIEFAMWNEGLIPEMRTRGGIAFIAYEVDKKTEEVIAIHYGRNSNPLKAFRAHGMFVLSSESKDQGHVDAQPNKCFSINYLTKEFSTREMNLDFSTTGSSGRSASSTPAVVYRGMGYPNFSHSHDVGFDTTRLLPSGSMADDIQSTDTTKQTHIFLSNDEVEMINKGKCSHGFGTFSDCQTCTIGLVKNKCKRSGNPVDRCYCKQHRKLTKIMQAKKKIKVGTEDGEVDINVQHIRSPYPYSGDTRCLVCQCDTGEGVYWNKDINDWAHDKCHRDSSNDEATKNLKFQASKLEQEIEEIETKIDQLEEMNASIEDKQDAVNAWCSNKFKIDDLKKEIDKKTEQLKNIEDFIYGRKF